MTEFTLGHGSIRSYKRLSYTPWHALAEFVDNSTQSYFDHRDELDRAFEIEGTTLRVAIQYDGSAETLEIADNSYGMDQPTLTRAMTVGEPPPNPTGRSRYGMGLKTSACWLGDFWTLRTTQLGEEIEYTVTVDVEKVASGESSLPLETTTVEPSTHYTIITISEMHVSFRGRRVGKTKDYLASMYREDIRGDNLELVWQGERIGWEYPPRQFLMDNDGAPRRRDLEFDVGDRTVRGWVGILEKGGRSQAGFSIFHSKRMVRGFPETWRPEEVFGQEQGSNNLINQRIVGEFHLDDFPVTHTKDDILWSDEEEVAVERAIRDEIADYLVLAEKTRVRTKSGPQVGSVRKAKETIGQDVARAQQSDSTPPTEEATAEAANEIDATTKRYLTTEADIDTTMLGRRLRAYFTGEEPPEAMFAATAIDVEEGVLVVANLRHPFLNEVVTAESLDLYLRLLLIDAATLAESAEWVDSSRWLHLRDSLMRTLAQSSMDASTDA
ncbi:MAG: ATP-binding protein [Candidatus Paceibacterota bacterium]